jgi:hypothetical protein
MNSILDESRTYEYLFFEKSIFRKFILEVTNIIFPK